MHTCIHTYAHTYIPPLCCELCRKIWEPLFVKSMIAIQRILPLLSSIRPFRLELQAFWQSGKPLWHQKDLLWPVHYVLVHWRFCTGSCTRPKAGDLSLGARLCSFDRQRNMQHHRRKAVKKMRQVKAQRTRCALSLQLLYNDHRPAQTRPEALHSGTP